MRLIFILIYSICISQCFARWATYGDLSYEIQKSITSVEVKKDGSYNEEVDITYKILKKDAIDILKFRQIIFDENISEVLIKKAESINNSLVSPVDITKLVAKSLNENKQGFNSLKVFKIGFSNLNIGTEIHYIYTRKVRIPSVKGHFSQRHIFGLTEFEKSSSTIIKSEIPLSYYVSDKNDVLEVKKYQKDKYYFLELNLKKAILKSPVGEYLSTLHQDEVTFIDISTDDNWEFLTANLEPEYRRVYEQKIPEAFLYILEKAKELKSQNSKVVLTMSEVIKKLTYMGFWNTSNGKLLPRDLESIARSMTGDCKDFTSLTIALLKAQGIIAYPSLVYRGNRGGGYLPQSLGPSMSSFNHVVLYIEDNKGGFWVDPTNQVSYGDAFEDISNRETFILKPKNTKISKLINKNGGTTNLLVKQAFEFKGELVEVKGIMKFDGVFSKAFLIGSIDINKRDKSILKLSNSDISPVAWNLSGLKEKSNILSKEKIQFNYSAKNTFSKSNSSFQFNFKNKVIDIYALANRERVTSLYIDNKLNIKRMTFLKNVKIVDSSLAECHVSSKWIDIKRKISENKKGIKIISTFNIKENILKNNDYNTDEWEILIDKLDECANTYLTFTTDKNYKKINLTDQLYKNGKLNLSFLADLSDNRDNQELLQISMSLIKKEPLNPYGYYYASKAIKASSYHSNSTFEKNTVKKALKFVDEMIKLSPENILFIDYYAEVNSDAGNKEVYNKYQKILEETYPNHPITKLQVAIRFKQGSEIKERELLDASLKNVNQLNREYKIKLYSFLGQHCGHYKRYKELDIFINKALKVALNKSWIYLTYSQDLTKKGDYIKAIEMGKKAIEKNSFGMGERNLAIIYYTIGALDLEKGESKKAEKNFLTSLIYQKLHESYIGLGSVALRSRKNKEAIKYYELAISMDPNNLYAHMKMLTATKPDKKHEVIQKIELLDISAEEKGNAFYRKCWGMNFEAQFSEKSTLCLLAVKYRPELYELYEHILNTKIDKQGDLSSSEVKKWVDVYLKNSTNSKEIFFKVKAHYFAGRFALSTAMKTREPASLARAKKHFEKVGEISPKDKHFVVKYLDEIKKASP